MRFSTDILAGLAESDFDKIGKSATLMQGLSRVEKFVRRGPQGYKDELKLFNMANRAMIKAADEENLEAATLAFHRLTPFLVQDFVFLVAKSVIGGVGELVRALKPDRRQRRRDLIHRLR
jgi:hypothetical protein